MGYGCYYSFQNILSSRQRSKKLKVNTYYITSCIVWLRVFENEVLRKMFGAKRDVIIGKWRKLHNAELHLLYSSTNIITNLKSRRLGWAAHVARMEQSRNEYRVVMGKPDEERSLGRRRRSWEDGIKMDLREMGCVAGEWTALAEDRDH